MELNKVCLIVLVITNLCFVSSKRRSDEGLTPPEIVANHGYPIEIHEVQTEDGYILTMHRIPHGINDTDTDTPRIPVFLEHGMGSNSGDYLASGPERSLGFILADLGYDVWLGNARGNTWSAKHITIDPIKDPEKFFNYTWHEIGVYDLPACIDHILNQTGADNTYYIGHSQGCTVFYTMAASRPEYNQKIRLASLMGPPAFMSHIPDVMLQIVSEFLEPVQELAHALGLYHIPFLDVARQFSRELCKRDDFFDVCVLIYNLAIGFEDNEQLDKSVFPIYLSNTPADFALKQTYHYAQLIKSAHFRQYDFGEIGNQEMYGTLDPPDYNISLITAPVALYYGKNDMHIGIEDVKIMAQQLPNLVSDYLIPYEKFNHGDFLIAKDAKTLLYEEMIREMSEH